MKHKSTERTHRITKLAQDFRIGKVFSGCKYQTSRGERRIRMADNKSGSCRSFVPIEILQYVRIPVV